MDSVDISGGSSYLVSGNQIFGAQRLFTFIYQFSICNWSFIDTTIFILLNLLVLQFLLQGKNDTVKKHVFKKLYPWQSKKDLALHLKNSEVYNDGKYFSSPSLCNVFRIFILL